MSEQVGLIRTKGTGANEALLVQWQGGNRPIRCEYDAAALGEQAVRELEEALDRIIVRRDPEIVNRASRDAVRTPGARRAHLFLQNHRL